jgi:hypothetical protein
MTSRGYQFMSALTLAFLLATSATVFAVKLPNPELAGMIAIGSARYGRIVEGSAKGQFLGSRFSGLGSSCTRGSPRGSGWSIQETGTITRHGRAVRPDSHQFAESKGGAGVASILAGALK